MYPFRTKRFDQISVAFFVLNELLSFFQLPLYFNKCGILSTMLARFFVCHYVKNINNSASSLKDAFAE